MLTTSEPIVVDKSPAPARAAFAGFLAGAFLAAGLLFVFAPATSLASHDRSRNDVASDVARQRQE